VPEIDIVDATWIGAGAGEVAAEVADPANWPRWFPDIELDVSELRGPKGVRWTVRAARWQTAGSMEVWLEPALDGVLAHYFLRLDRRGRPLGSRTARRAEDHFRRQAKRALWAVSDRLDPGRLGRMQAGETAPVSVGGDQGPAVTPARGDGRPHEE
jgi:hypothetical protein